MCVCGGGGGLCGSFGMDSIFVAPMIFIHFCTKALIGNAPSDLMDSLPAKRESRSHIPSMFLDASPQGAEAIEKIQGRVLYIPRRG